MCKHACAGLFMEGFMSFCRGVGSTEVPDVSSAKTLGYTVTYVKYLDRTSKTELRNTKHHCAIRNQTLYFSLLLLSSVHQHTPECPNLCRTTHPPSTQMSSRKTSPLIYSPSSLWNSLPQATSEDDSVIQAFI